MFSDLPDQSSLRGTKVSELSKRKTELANGHEQMHTEYLLNLTRNTHLGKDSFTQAYLSMEA